MWVVFWNVGFDFVYEIVIYVGVFGEDVVVEMGEDGD